MIIILQIISFLKGVFLKIAVFGTGYVGLVTGVCFAEMGNTVTCIDVDKNKISDLQKGISPIYEPGLDKLLSNNIKAQRLFFTTDPRESIGTADVLFIAVGTPPKNDGSADLKYVEQVAQTIGDNLTNYKIIVNKSTVPVGTVLKVKNIISNSLQKRNLSVNFDVASNPEFLREGCAIDDCLKPNRVVLGVESSQAQNQLQKLYAPFLTDGSQLIFMDPASSELTKYAANSMLAAKISIMNEYSRLCEKLGADIEAVKKGIGSDHRIGPHFINAGLGYGGSCFPKDVSALIQIGKENDEQLEILKAVEKTNLIQRDRFIQKISSRLSNIPNKSIAVWGVAFKPGTDDIREAPSLDIIEHFLKLGYTVHVYDPVASRNAKDYFNHNPQLVFFDDQYKALNQVAALVIPTEWMSFREPDFQLMKKLMQSPLIFDGRNIYNPQYIIADGFEYISIGRRS